MSYVTQHNGYKTNGPYLKHHATSTNQNYLCTLEGDQIEVEVGLSRRQHAEIVEGNKSKQRLGRTRQRHQDDSNFF